MRGPAENRQPVARAETREELVAFIEAEIAEPTEDSGVESSSAYGLRQHTYRKAFRVGGPLEWYNPPFGLDEAIQDLGTREQWIARAVERAEQDWQYLCSTVPAVPAVPSASGLGDTH